MSWAVLLGGLAGVADQDPAFGAFEDLGDRRRPGDTDAGANGDRDAKQVVGQGSGLAAEEGSPGAIGQRGGFEAGDGVGGRELTIQCFGDDAAQPS